jgi:hypothetical protein
MRSRGLVAAAVALIAGADGTEGEKDRLQGTWAMVSLEINGEKTADEEVKTARLVVEAADDRPRMPGPRPRRAPVTQTTVFFTIATNLALCYCFGGCRVR